MAPYIGGKSRLAARIIKLIESIEHTTYAEPFVGMGGIFLRRPTRAKSEVINDFNREVATFFRILQRHYVPFMEMMKFGITTRAEFERLSRTDPDTLTDLERAARFLYLQRTAFGGKVVGQSFGVSRDTGARFDITRLGPMLEDLHSRLSSVVIERLDYAEFITRYDGDRTLFYLDPPYRHSENDYGAGRFTPKDFAKLAALLADVRGRFILSINDTKEMRAVFAPFKIRGVKTRYSVARSTAGRAKVGELIITGPVRGRSQVGEAKI